MAGFSFRIAFIFGISPLKSHDSGDSVCLYKNCLTLMMMFGAPPALSLLPLMMMNLLSLCFVITLLSPDTPEVITSLDGGVMKSRLEVNGYLSTRRLLATVS